MKLNHRYIRAASACLLAVTACTALALVFASCRSDSSVSSIRWVACPEYFTQDANARCGYVKVPDIRNGVSARTIENYVVVFKALEPDTGQTSSPAVSSPIFFLNGGPGATNYAAHLAFMSPSDTMRKTFGTHRDIVITAQRGTNRSTPNLYYQGLEPDRQKAYEMDFDEESALRIEATMRNYDRFVDEGVNLSGVNTLDIVKDIKVLKDILYPHDQINIWSASYGTRVAMTCMKLYPEILRSVLLDSVLPPEINPFIEEIPGILYSREQFFKASRDDYPNLETLYNEILTDLETGPVRYYRIEEDQVLYDVKITAAKFFLFVKAQLQSTPYDTDLPQKIIKIHQGDYEEIAKAWIGNVNYEFPVGEAKEWQTCDAVFESVFGATDASFVTPEDTQAMIDAYVTRESVKTYFRHQFIYGYPCSEGAWVVDQLPKSMQAPVTGDIPTLMVVGTLDPQTPAIFSRDAAQRLTQSYYHEILGGHAVSNLACVQDMVSAFYADPMTAPVNNCPTTYTWTSDAPPSLKVSRKIQSQVKTRLFPDRF